MANDPTISFVIAVRNRPQKVCRSIASVPLDRDDIEIVVVDDASTDDTVRVIRQRFGDRVRMVLHDERRGAGAARNSGFKAATAPWCFVLDSDNTLLPDAMEGIEAALEGSPDVAVLFLGSALASGRPTGSKTLPDGKVHWHELLCQRRLSGEYCVAVRRDAILECPYDETLGRDNTILTWLQIARAHGLAVYDRQVLEYDDTGDDRLTGRQQALDDPADAARCHVEFLDMFGEDLLRIDRKEWGDHLGRAAFFHVLAGERRRASHEARQALRAGPQRSTLIAWAAIVLGPRAARACYRG